MIGIIWAGRANLRSNLVQASGNSMTGPRFRQQLRQQLSFIETSCVAYDSGKTEEAVRIATCLRVLFHQTRKSTSLLTHLTATDVGLLSTCPVDKNISPETSFEGLCGISGYGVMAKLGNTSTSIELTAGEWWEQFVLGLGQGRNLSRKVIALTAADKDGGAHVDEELPEDYELLVHGLWVGNTSGKVGRVPDHQLIYLRQMGYEILNSPKLREAAA